MTDERRHIPIYMDIEICPGIFYRDRFDWDLSYSHITVNEFVKLFGQKLNLQESQIQRLNESVLEQIIEYIEKLTHYPKKQQKNFDAIVQEEEIKKNFNVTTQNQLKIIDNKLSIQLDTTEKDIFNAQQEQPQIKLTQRQKKLNEIKKNENLTTSKTQYLRRLCKYCKFYHYNLVTECKSCKLPFSIIEEMNLQDMTLRLSCRFFVQCRNQIPYIINSNLYKDLTLKDFQSVYILKNKFCELLQQEEEQSQQKEEFREAIRIIEEVLADFLKGKYDEEENKEIKVKNNDEENDLKKSDVFKRDKLIKQPIKKRGRPQKILKASKYKRKAHN